MAYPTGMLSITLEDIDRRMVGVKLYAAQVRAELLAGNVSSSRILDLVVNLRQERLALVTAASVQGIGAYAQAQKNNGTLDVVAEFNAVIAAIDSVTSWIGTNFPKDGSGFLLAQTMTADGPLDRQFAPAVTSGLASQLANLVATIN